MARGRGYRGTPSKATKRCCSLPLTMLTIHLCNNGCMTICLHDHMATLVSPVYFGPACMQMAPHRDRNSDWDTQEHPARRRILQLATTVASRHTRFMLLPLLPTLPQSCQSRDLAGGTIFCIGIIET